MALRVLHILSQRSGLTGSGVTLEALVLEAGAAGWDQRVLVGVPAGDPPPRIRGLRPQGLAVVSFGGQSSGADLPFPIPGMSDVMPYPSSVWSSLSDGQLALYRRVWKDRIALLANEFKPHVIHVNHVWLVSALAPGAAPGTPVVCACHATGLRQMELCPHLRDEVVRGCRRIDRFVVLRHDHRNDLASAMGVDPDRIAVIGAGYRDDLFGPRPGTDRDPGALVYVGKYSESKGLPWLLDAVEILAEGRPELRLHVAGSGSGPEADRLRARMEGMEGRVILHGMLGQDDLADLMRRCAVCVLPSFYEGVPLVLVEAAACGCRIVATALPGVVEQIEPALAGSIDLVPLPRLVGIDRPAPDDLPAFTAGLAAALGRALDRDRKAGAPDLAPFTWRAVFRRVEAVWKDASGVK